MAKAVREDGIGRIRVVGIVVRGDQTEAGEAGQLDGPVPRGGTTRGPVQQIVEAWGLIPCHDYGGRWVGMVRRERMARWNGRLESSRNGPFQPPILVYAMDGAQRERGIG